MNCLRAQLEAILRFQKAEAERTGVLMSRNEAAAQWIQAHSQQFRTAYGEEHEKGPKNIGSHTRKNEDSRANKDG